MSFNNAACRCVAETALFLVHVGSSEVHIGSSHADVVQIKTHVMCILQSYIASYRCAADLTCIWHTHSSSCRRVADTACGITSMLYAQKMRHNQWPVHTHTWDTTGWRRCIGCLVLIGHFPRKGPISGSFAERDLQLGIHTSSPPCIRIPREPHPIYRHDLHTLPCAPTQRVR